MRDYDHPLDDVADAHRRRRAVRSLLGVMVALAGVLVLTTGCGLQADIGAGLILAGAGAVEPTMRLRR